VSSPADKLPSPEVADVLERALRLPRRDQEYLAARLRFGVATDEDAWPDGMHPAWKDEILARLKSVEDASAKLLDGDEVLRKLLAKHKG
jgi:Ni,Fe-hydrogenase III component G